MMNIVTRSSTSTSTSSTSESIPTGSGSRVSAISVVSSIVVVAAAIIVTVTTITTATSVTNDASPEQSSSSLPLFVSAETVMRRRTNVLRSILLSEPVLVEDDVVVDGHMVDQPIEDSTITVSRTDDESESVNDHGYKVDGQEDIDVEDVDLDLDLASDMIYNHYGYGDDESFREFQIRSLHGRRQMKSSDSSSSSHSRSSPSPSSSVRADTYTSRSDRFCVERCASRSRSPSNPYRNTFTLNRWV